MLAVHPTVRIKPPSHLTNQKWVVDNLYERKRHVVSPAALVVILAAMTNNEKNSVVNKVRDKLNISRERVEYIIEKLIENDILVENYTQELQWCKEILDKWHNKGWGSAADYYLSTYDYEFHEADRDGLDRTRERMRSYSDDTYDSDRAKRYSDAEERVHITEVSANLVPQPVVNGLIYDEDRKGALTFETLGKILAMSFGKVGDVLTKPYWNGEPIFRRTSPSGGGRHPCEAYLINLGMDELRKGWYHFSTLDSELEWLNLSPIVADPKELFPNLLNRAPFEVKAIVIVTCYFERHMFRYREPRTYRSVHLDAGHLCSTVEMTSNVLGIRSFVQYGGNDRLIEQQLGISGLQEGYFLSIALG